MRAGSYDIVYHNVHQARAPINHETILLCFTNVQCFSWSLIIAERLIIFSISFYQANVVNKPDKMTIYVMFITGKDMPID